MGGGGRGRGGGVVRRLGVDEGIVRVDDLAFYDDW